MLNVTFTKSGFETRSTLSTRPQKLSSAHAPLMCLMRCFLLLPKDSAPLILQPKNSMFTGIPQTKAITPAFAIWQPVFIMNDNKVLPCFVYQVHVNGERTTGGIAFRYDLVDVEDWQKFRYATSELCGFFIDRDEKDIYSSKAGLVASL